MNNSFFAKRMSASRAAGLVGGAVFASAAAIDVARVWTSVGAMGSPRLPAGTSEASQVLSGILVAIFALSGFALAVRAKALAPICVVAFYALLAHGSSLVLSGEVIGAIYLGIVPLAIALSRVTMGDAWHPSTRARLFPSPGHALAAEHAASPSLSTTLA